MQSSTTAHAQVHAIHGASEAQSEPRRASLCARDWLWFHLRIGLFGFGHGAVMPMYERALVRDSHTLTPAQFNEALTVSLVLPGPSLITLSMYLGKQLYGSLVGLLGVLAMCVPGALWALLIVVAIPIELPAVRAVFRGFTVGALVLLIAMLWRLQHGLRADALITAPVTTRKYVARLLLSLAVAALLAAQLPMTAVAACGVLACLAVEFAS